MVQARVAQGLVAVCQCCLVDGVGAAQAFGYVVAGHLYVDTAGEGAQSLVHLEEATNLVEHVVEAAGLVAGGHGDGVAVHRVGDPDDLRAFSLHALNDCGQLLADVLCAHAGDEGQAAGFAVRVELIDQCECVLCGGGRAQLHADGVADLGEEVHVGVIDAAGALANPQEVCGGVVGQLGARVDAGEGTLVVHYQGFVADVHVGGLECFEVNAAGFHELEGATNFVGGLLVALMRGVGGEAAVPLVYGAQVCEAALGEGANQVQGGGAGVVAAQHALGVVHACFGGEVEAVDSLTAEGGQGDVAAGFHVCGARLGELTRHAAHLHHGHGRAVGEHCGHLQDGLNAAGNLVGGCAREGFCTVAALQEECAAFGNLAECLTHGVDFTGEDERGHRVQFGDGAFKIFVLAPGGLLVNVQLTPGV